MEKISQTLDYIWVTFFMLTFFKFNKNIQIKTFETFALTEDDTVWQIIIRVKDIECPQMRSKMFYQIIEEVFHAEEFVDTLKKNGYTIPSLNRHERSPLYPENSEAWRFLVYCNIGESEAATRFKNILKWLPRESTYYKSLNKVLMDEIGHVHLAKNIIKELGITDREYAKEWWRIFSKRRFDSLKMTSKRLLSALLTIVFYLIYFTSGPFLKHRAKKRMSSNITYSSTSFEEIYR